MTRWINTGRSFYKLDMFEYFEMYLEGDHVILKTIRGYYKDGNNNLQYKVIYTDDSRIDDLVILKKVFSRLIKAITKDYIDVINVRDFEDDESESTKLLEMPITKTIEYIPYTTYDHPYIPEPCRTCPNHPSNGGSGICHCTLGSPVIYTTTTSTNIGD